MKKRIYLSLEDLTLILSKLPKGGTLWKYLAKQLASEGITPPFLGSSPEGEKEEEVFNPGLFEALGLPPELDSEEF
jgi:hypothetical protein